MDVYFGLRMMRMLVTMVPGTGIEIEFITFQYLLILHVASRVHCVPKIRVLLYY